MTTFLENRPLYPKYQLDYRKNNSTATLLLKMKEEIDKTMITVRKQSVFTDISKAFGTIYN